MRGMRYRRMVPHRAEHITQQISQLEASLTPAVHRALW